MLSVLVRVEFLIEYWIIMKVFLTCAPAPGSQMVQGEMFQDPRRIIRLNRLCFL